jgi:hypothetical protein
MEQGDEVHGDGDGYVLKMIKLQVEKKKEKTKTMLIKAKVSNRLLFWHSRHHRGCECT